MAEEKDQVELDEQAEGEEREAEATEEAGASGKKKTTTRKEQIIALYLSGMHDVEDLSMVTSSRPSYIASVLRDAGFEQNYFDLYTSTKHPMNVYSKFFADQLGFKDVDRTRESVDHIDTLFNQFEVGGDRAGQHHAMMMALTMANRAHWTGKHAEATLFREWLIEQLQLFNQESYQTLAERDEEE